MLDSFLHKTCGVLCRDFWGNIMRAIHALPMLAAIMLAACGGSEEKAAGGLSKEEVAAEASTAIKPQPGQYTSTVELLAFDVPGLTGPMMEQMKVQAQSGLAQGNSFCLTPDKADPKAMLQNIAESDCTFNQFDVNGTAITADMVCKGNGGPEGHVQMDGTMTANGSVMTMAMQQSMGNMGVVNMKMRVTSKRTGDCS